MWVESWESGGDYRLTPEMRAKFYIYFVGFVLILFHVGAASDLNCNWLFEICLIAIISFSASSTSVLVERASVDHLSRWFFIYNWCAKHSWDNVDTDLELATLTFTNLAFGQHIFSVAPHYHTSRT